MILILGAIGIVVGFMLGLTGAGGGVLAVPLLGLLLGMDIHDAITLSLIGVGVISAFGLFRYAKRDEIQWSLALPVSIAAIFGAPLGTIIATQLTPVWLTFSFIGLSLFSVFTMLRGGCRANVLAEPLHEHQEYRANWQVHGVGFITGILSGCFGVGGGFLLVPALHIFANVEIKVAARISLCAITAATTVALLSRVVEDVNIPYFYGAIMATFGLLGLVHGQILAIRLRPCRLKEVFGSSLLVILLLMFVDTIYQ